MMCSKILSSCNNSGKFTHFLDNIFRSNSKFGIKAHLQVCWKLAVLVLIFAAAILLMLPYLYTHLPQKQHLKKIRAFFLSSALHHRLQPSITLKPLLNVLMTFIRVFLNRYYFSINSAATVSGIVFKPWSQRRTINLL